MINTQLALPLLDGKRFTMSRDPAVISPVHLLLLHGGPSAIIRLVAASIVYAVNRVFGRWTRPHIRGKRCERIEPSVAHLDTDCSVSRIALATRIVAAGLDALPCLVFERQGTALRVPVLDVAVARQFASKTAARLRRLVSRLRTGAPEHGAANASLCTAIAAAQPQSVSAPAYGSADISDDGPAAKSLPGEIDARSGHFAILPLGA